MPRTGPIIIIEDDADDQKFISEAIEQLGFTNQLLVFESAQSTMDYLLSTSDKPFLILCDVNMPKLNGIQLRKMIDDNEYLRKKSIPFVFIATSDMQKEVNEAYELTIQGYFKKPASPEELKTLLGNVITYWSLCRHPNNYELE